MTHEWQSSAHLAKLWSLGRKCWSPGAASWVPPAGSQPEPAYSAQAQQVSVEPLSGLGLGTGVAVPPAPGLYPTGAGNPELRASRAREQVRAACWLGRVGREWAVARGWLRTSESLHISSGACPLHCPLKAHLLPWPGCQGQARSGHG